MSKIEIYLPGGKTLVAKLRAALEEAAISEDPRDRSSTNYTAIGDDLLDVKLAFERGDVSSSRVMVRRETADWIMEELTSRYDG